jgi:DJ-1/PfpI family
VSLFEIAARLRGLNQRIRPVDDRRDLAGLDQLLQSCQIPVVRSRGCAAGILRGLRANTHWLARDQLTRFGAITTDERVVEDGKVITAAGVSSGIDMALVFAARLAGDEVARAIQLSVEYDAQPPFDTGTPAKAPGPIQDMVRAPLVERDKRMAQRAGAR